MNTTDFRCILKLNGWKLVVAQRQSKWADNHGNSLIFYDESIKLRIKGQRPRSYSYWEDLQPIMELILENTHDTKPVQSDTGSFRVPTYKK